MSNLKLPNLSWKSLDTILPPLTGNLQWGRAKKIGYETWAWRDGDEIVIRHHSTDIARIGIWSVDITPHGYASSTTTARLHKIMVDNGLWPSGWTFAIRQFSLALITRDDMKKGTPVPYNGVSFEMVAGVWTLKP